MPKLRSLFARNHRSGNLQIRIEFRDQENAWTYFLAFGNEKDGKHRPIVKAEEVTHNGEVLLTRPNDDDRQDPERLTQTHLEQISMNVRFRVLAERLSRTSYLHLVPQIIRDPRRATDTDDDPFGSHFIAEINATKPKKTQDARLKRMEKALQAAVPQFKTLTISVDAAGKPHLHAGYHNWRPNRAIQTEADFSDGTLRLLGLLWSLAKLPDATSTLLLEEPELSLSPDVVRMLPSVLAVAQRNQDAQIILTSHAPDLIDDEGVSPDEVLVLQVTGDGTTGFLLADDLALVADLDDGIPASSLIRPFVAPEHIRDLGRVESTEQSTTANCPDTTEPPPETLGSCCGIPTPPAPSTCAVPCCATLLRQA